MVNSKGIQRRIFLRPCPLGADSFIRWIAEKSISEGDFMQIKRSHITYFQMIVLKSNLKKIKNVILMQI